MKKFLAALKLFLFPYSSIKLEKLQFLLVLAKILHFFPALYLVIEAFTLTTQFFGGLLISPENFSFFGLLFIGLTLTMMMAVPMILAYFLVLIAKMSSPEKQSDF